MFGWKYLEGNLLTSSGWLIARNFKFTVHGSSTIDVTTKSITSGFVTSGLITTKDITTQPMTTRLITTQGLTTYKNFGNVREIMILFFDNSFRV
jgi:hypothetical protein